MENLVTTTTTETTIFQNGNPVPAVEASAVIITPEVSAFVDQYKTFLRKTAESIIGLAETLLSAEEKLNELEFSIFCDQVGITKGDSTYSKLKKIGEASNRFRPFVEKLPNAWTTLYKLARLEPGKFDTVIQSVTPYMTDKELQLHLGKPTETKAKEPADLKISFGTMSPELKKEAYLKIDELKKTFNFEVQANNSFISELKEVSSEKAA